jgi:hypothetical protein
MEHGFWYTFKVPGVDVKAGELEYRFIRRLGPCFRRYSVIATGKTCHEIPTTSRSRDSLLVTCSTCASFRSAALKIALITVFLSSIPTTLSTS